MKREELKASFERIKPDEAAKRRMLENIMNEYERKKGKNMALNLRRAIPALAMVFVISGGLLVYSLTEKYNNNLSGSDRYSDADYPGTAREDYAAPILNQFQLGNRHYILLTDDLREEFRLPAVIDEKDIGEKIGIIEKSIDSSLIGSEIYGYIPAGCEAIVAVKIDNEYKLFRFFSFESYNSNRDEDAVEYLKLYGINNAEDIAEIYLISHSEQGKIQGYTDIVAKLTDRKEIADFYRFYSALKDSSDKYFDTLFNYRSNYTDGAETGYAAPGIADPELYAPDRTGGTGETVTDIIKERDSIAEDLPLIKDNDNNGVQSADTPVSNRQSEAGFSGYTDMGNTGSGEVSPSHGSAGYALENFITIRIFNQNGIYYDSPYYRNIGFISRYELNEEFREFLEGYIK